MDDGPVNKANAFASAAEDFTEKGHYANALEAHFRAAEQFLTALSHTTDPEAIKTLKLLYANHTRQGKKLQRQVQAANATAKNGGGARAAATKASAAGSASGRQRPVSMPPGSYGHIDPRQPYHSAGPSSSIIRSQSQQQGQSGASHHQQTSSKQAPGFVHNGPQQGQQTQRQPLAQTPYAEQARQASSSTGASEYGTRHYFVGQLETASGSFQAVGPGQQLRTRNMPGEHGNDNNRRHSGPSVPHDKYDNNAYGSGRWSGMNDSHRASWQPATTPVVSLDDSETDSVRHTFSMVEPDKSNFQNSQQSTAAAATTEDESDDPFNKFWEAVENLVEKISLTGPVAFATAPLDSESGGNPSGSINSVNSNGTGDPLSPSGRDMGDTLRTTTMLNSYFIVPGGGIGDSGMNGTYRTSYGSSNISGSRQPGYQQHVPSQNFFQGGVMLPTGRDPHQTGGPMMLSGLESNYFGQAGSRGDDSTGNANFVSSGAASAEPVTLSAAPNNSTNNRFGHVASTNNEYTRSRLGSRMANSGSTSWVTPGASSSTAREYGGVRDRHLASQQAFHQQQQQLLMQRESLQHQNPSNKTMEELVMENEHLRHAVDILTRKVAILERAAEENNLLKSSIIQFRQDVQKQAKRFMHQTPASASGGIGASFGGGRLRTGGSGHESHDIAQNLSHRVQELEEELRRQKEESDRQSLAMAKYKERWDKLKESAKKKKEAAAASTSGHSNGQLTRIGDGDSSLSPGSTGGPSRGPSLFGTGEGALNRQLVSYGEEFSTKSPSSQQPQQLQQVFSSRAVIDPSSPIVSQLTDEDSKGQALPENDSQQFQDTYRSREDRQRTPNVVDTSHLVTRASALAPGRPTLVPSSSTFASTARVPNNARSPSPAPTSTSVQTSLDSRVSAGDIFGSDDSGSLIDYATRPTKGAAVAGASNPTQSMPYDSPRASFFQRRSSLSDASDAPSPLVKVKTSPTAPSSSSLASHAVDASHDKSLITIARHTRPSPVSPLSSMTVGGSGGINLIDLDNEEPLPRVDEKLTVTDGETEKGKGIDIFAHFGGHKPLSPLGLDEFINFGSEKAGLKSAESGKDAVAVRDWNAMIAPKKGKSLFPPKPPDPSFNIAKKYSSQPQSPTEWSSAPVSSQTLDYRRSEQGLRAAGSISDTFNLPLSPSSVPPSHEPVSFRRSEYPGSKSSSEPPYQQQPFAIPSSATSTPPSSSSPHSPRSPNLGSASTLTTRSTRTNATGGASMFYSATSGFGFE